MKLPRLDCTKYLGLIFDNLGPFADTAEVMLSIRPTRYVHVRVSVPIEDRLVTMERFVPWDDCMSQSPVVDKLSFDAADLARSCREAVEKTVQGGASNAAQACR